MRRLLSHPGVQLALLVLGIFPYLYISQFIHPAGDDFSYSVKTWDNSFTSVFTDEYLHHNGRYFSNLLVLVNPMSYYSLVIYKAVPVFLLLMLAIAFYIFFTAVFSNCISRSKRATLSLVFLLIFLSGMPDLAEGLYWYTGAVSYTLALVPLLIYASLALFSLREVFIAGNRMLHYFLMAVFLFIASGFNEVLTVCISGFHLFILVVDYFHFKRINKKVLLFTGLAAGCMLLMLLAPGNGVRADKYDVKFDLMHSAGLSALYTIRFVAEWLSGASLWLVSGLLIFLFRKTLGKGEPVHPVFRFRPLNIFLLMCLFVFMVAFLPCYGTGQLGQHRTMNTAWFFFLMGWVWLSISVYYRFREHVEQVVGIYKGSHLLLKGALFIVIAFSGNSYVVLQDIHVGKAKAFDREMKIRYEGIQRCLVLEDPVCDIPFLKNKPESIFIYDLQADPGHWLNKSYSVYFRKRELMVKPY